MPHESGMNRYGGLTLVPTSERFLPLAEEVKRNLEILDKRTATVRFPTKTDIALPINSRRANGEPFVQLGNEHICDHDVYILTSGPGTPEMLIELFMAEMYAVGRHASRVTVISGYAPLSRSDKDEGELELAVFPHIIHLIENAAYGKLHRIVSCDLHVAQGVMASSRPALITEVSIIRILLTKAIEEALTKFPIDKIIINWPDVGAAKRFAWAFKKVCEKFNFKFPVVIGQKTRESSKSSSLDNLFGDLDRVPGSLVIEVDDEIATGSTMRNTAAEFKSNYGAAACWSVSVHGVFCGEAVDEFQKSDCPIDEIYTADTIPYNDRPEKQMPFFASPRMHVVSWGKEVAQIVSHHHWGHSIRTFR